MSESSLSDQLCNACASGKLSEVLFLLQNGAHVNGLNKFKRTALQVAMLGNTPVIEALLAAEANPNLRDPACGLTVTHDAAREGFVDSVRALLNHEADVNIADEKGNLPLHLAAREGHLEVVRLVIAHTKSPDAANSLGYTAGQLARDHNRRDTATFIQEYVGSN